MRAVAVRLRAPTRPQHRPGAHGAVRAHDSLRQRSWALSASTLRALHAQTSNGTIGTTLYLAVSPYVGDTISRDLARSRVKRTPPIIRSKRSVYEDVCSTLNRLKTPRWADTARWASALHDTWIGRPHTREHYTTRSACGARGHARTCESLVPLASRPPPDVARQVAHAALTTRRTL